MTDHRLIREFFLGFIKIHILYHAAQAPVCGVDLGEELARHGYHVSPGTLYPTLHALERAGYLQRESRTVHGRRRKYYCATGDGRSVLQRARKQACELLDEIVENDG
ncbi:MAG: PadR family transcriptional regulator [Spirochaetaceae bacterium]|nr:MAG: PadR family transcriptional regulator [Spirochaetaceae bacterium]